MNKKEKREIALGYLKAKTARGGDLYELYKEFDDTTGEIFADRFIKDEPRLLGTVYRGYMTTKEWFDAKNLQVGKTICIEDLYHRHLPSFTKSEVRASLYSVDATLYQSDAPFHVVFEVELKGLYCVDISKYSVYPEESECVFIDEAKAVIVEVVQSNRRVKVKLKEK